MTNKSFEYKAKLIGSPENGNIVPFKYLSSFWRFLDLPWIISEIELDLSWSKECVNSWSNPVAAIQTTGSAFQINNAKL